MANKMNFTLVDDPSSDIKLRGTVVKEGGGLTLYVDGYGDGQPIAGLVLQDGKLKLLAFPDINSPEPKVIDFEGAKHGPRDWSPRR